MADAEVALLRAIHGVGAVLLLGNVTVTGFWAAYFYRARKQVPFRLVARAILWADLLFTLGGGALLAVSGVLLVRTKGYAIAETPWLMQGIGALAGSTALWLAFLLPDQWRLERINPADEATLKRIFRRWSVVGWTATALLFYGLWAMVSKR
jgi:uncharacterized membrane protein